MFRSSMFVCLAFVVTAMCCQPCRTTAQERVTSGLQVVYDFQAVDGDSIRDVSGNDPAIDLKIEDTKKVKREAGTLEFVGDTIARSTRKPSRLVNAIQWTGEASIEAWIKPAKTDMNGPARILSFSLNSNQRNFTLGQEYDHFEMRYRTSTTSQNGLPATVSDAKTLKAELVHVVFTRDRNGQAQLFLNGEQVANKQIDGTLAGWESAYSLTLGNEISGGRSWLGTYYLVGIYNRALQPHEVKQNFSAGENAKASPKSVAVAGENPNDGHFVTSVARIFSEHCLECHDSANHEGGLDLSKRTDAFVGGESGGPIVPGDASESLLWTSVESDEMPSDRPALSDEEKDAIKTWINNGANWPVKTIDPSIYSHSGKAQGIWLRRMTINEYVETVRSAVGVEIREDAVAMLPPDLRADGFSNTAYNLNVDLKHVQAYAKLAEKIADGIDVPKLVREHTRHQEVTENHLRDIVSDLCRWLFRGPENTREVESLILVVNEVIAAGGSPEDATRMLLETMLQSPRFIYRIENQRGDGRAQPVDPFELANRLSYMIWGGPPDEELLKAAESRDLYDQEKLRSHVERMLKDPRAVRQSREFIEQWLDLGRLANLQPNAERFPQWNAKLAADMRLETLAYFEELAWKQQRPLAELLDGQFTYATPDLAAHYGLKDEGLKDEHKSKADVSDGELVRYDLSDIPGRGGLLTHGSVLTVGGDEASMVARGLFVLSDLLRGSIKDPPPCVDTTPVPAKKGLTQRGIASERIANANCGGCHSKFEPLAFGLEKFDGIGAFHEEDEFGNKLRDDGRILFPGERESVEYANSAEMMKLLAGSDRVRECITWKVTQFAIGRPLTALDAPILMEIDEQSKSKGGTYASLITAIALSDLVRKTMTEGF